MLEDFNKENLTHFFELENGRKYRRDEIKKFWSNKCAYCGCQPEVLTLDHVKPVCKGRDDRDFNLVPACLDCQRLKGNKSLEEFFEMGFVDEIKKSKIIRWHYQNLD